MRVLVIGASGQLARSLAALDAMDDELRVFARGRPDVDLGNAGALAAAIERSAPDVVVNAAAYTAVDKAETDRAGAFAVNAAGAGAVAVAAASAHLPVIHVSTDYVFDGERDEPYCEDDLPDPRTVYGRSKFAGETAVAVSNPDHAILRTAWVYSPWGGNFVKTMLRLAGERDVIRVVADQHGNPTYAPDLADAILAIAREMVESPHDVSLRGTFHLAGPEATTWYGFAQEIMTISESLGGPSAEIMPITSVDYPTPAPRPRNSRLDTTLARAAFDVRLPPREQSLRRCIGELLGEAAPLPRPPRLAPALDTCAA